MAEGKTEFVIEILPNDKLKGEKLESFTLDLRNEIKEGFKEVKVSKPTPLIDSQTEEGAKGDPITMGAIAVTLLAGGGVVTKLIDYLMPRLLGNNVTKISVNGNSIELTNASAEEKEKLFKLFIEQSEKSASTQDG